MDTSTTDIIELIVYIAFWVWVIVASTLKLFGRLQKLSWTTVLMLIIVATFAMNVLHFLLTGEVYVHRIGRGL